MKKLIKVKSTEVLKEIKSDVNLFVNSACVNDHSKLKKNNNFIRYCEKCDKAV